MTTNDGTVSFSTVVRTRTRSQKIPVFKGTRVRSITAQVLSSQFGAAHCGSSPGWSRTSECWRDRGASLVIRKSGRYQSAIGFQACGTLLAFCDSARRENPTAAQHVKPKNSDFKVERRKTGMDHAHCPNAVGASMSFTSGSPAARVVHRRNDVHSGETTAGEQENAANRQLSLLCRRGGHDEMKGRASEKRSARHVNALS